MKRMFLIELSVMTVLVLFCIFRSYRSRKEISRPVVYVLGAVVVPLLGNIVIASSTDPVICNAGYIMFLLGTNLVLYTLIDFSIQYCSFPPMKRSIWYLITGALVADSISVFLNIFFMRLTSMIDWQKKPGASAGGSGPTRCPAFFEGCAISSDTAFAAAGTPGYR